MKLTLVVVLAGIVALALATPVKYQTVVTKDLVERQKLLLPLFYHINQPSYYPEHIEIAKGFSHHGIESHFTKPEVVKHFFELYSYGLLPKGEIFSVFYQQHLEQAIALFKLFYYAQDFQTFYHAAVWARQHVNEGLFLYAYSVAIVHRSDTNGIVLPPIYEIYPHYFYNSEVINKAQYYKQIYHGQADTFTINANYSGHYLNLHPEQSMSYYTEDVGINSFYYYYNIFYPEWMSSEEFHFVKNNRGEQYYFLYQQLMARYYLERLSNDFGEIEHFDWDLFVATPYYPSLEYPNGLAFPIRPAYAKLHEYFYNYGQKWSWVSKYGYSYSFVQDYERRIHDAIDQGYVYSHNGQKVDLYNDKNGFNVLGNLIESNEDSPNQKYYGSIQEFARHLLGYSYQPLTNYHLAPSALEHFETTLRDPAFYQFYKKIVLYFQRYKSYLAPYTKTELFFPGVSVHNVEFDQLVTYFDYFYSDISSAVYVTPEEFVNNNFKVRARQHRLNHKPFTYKIHVNSNQETKAVVKIFLGPKYDEYGRHINISQNRMNFVQFDNFIYELKSGENVIQRNSYDSYFYGPDRTSYQDLYKQVMAGSDFSYDWRNSYFTFPSRYLLPKGSFSGVHYQFYVIVAPYVPYQGDYVQENQVKNYPHIGSGAQYIDGYALGYPFDRFINYEQMFYNIPNSYFYETKIFHKKVEDINASTAGN